MGILDHQGILMLKIWVLVFHVGSLDAFNLWVIVYVYVYPIYPLLL